MAQRKSLASQWTSDEFGEVLHTVVEKGDVSNTGELLATKYGVNSLVQFNNELMPLASTAWSSTKVFEGFDVFADFTPEGLPVTQPAGEGVELDWRRSEIVQGYFGQLLGGYLDILEDVSEYSPTTVRTTSGQTTQNVYWTSRLKGKVDQFWADYADVSPFFYKSDLIEEARQAKSSYEDVSSQTAIELSRLSDANERLEKIEDAAREATGQIAAGTYVKRYNDEVKTQNKTAIFWAVILVIFGIVLAYMIFEGEALSPDAKAIELGSRAIRLALPTAALVFSIRQFSAARHNVLIFKNKALSLGTFDAFVEASPDEATRSAVVLEVSKAVFSQQPTGFLKGGSGTPETTSTNIITEAFKSGQ